MVSILKNLTTVNYNKTSKKNKYIVIHWVGAVSTAKNNGVYFKSVDRGASAHYFVDDDEIVQVVEDKDVAWHCGTTGTYYHKECRNSNSIGIEMCLDKANNISDTTIKNTSELVKSLMAKYKIPAGNVVRHYDITHKLCPGPYVAKNKWDTLHKTLTGGSTTTASNGKTNTGSQTASSKDKTSGSSFSKPTRLLRLGSKGNDVKWLQNQLNTKQNSKLQVDGIFGSNTNKAVLAFQKKSKLSQDGIVGPKTLGKITGTAQSNSTSKGSTNKPVTSAFSKPTRLLVSGSQGNDVKWLQEQLNKVGKSNLQVDGIFGANTKAAVLAFQKSKKLAQDGIVGPKTTAKLA